MQSFRDILGRTWTVAITVTACKQVRALVGVDLLGEADAAGKLLGDACKLVDVLYVLCRDQAMGQVSDEDFGRSFTGETLETAGDALVEALIDFFQKSPRGEILRKIREASRELKTLSQAQLEKIDPRAEAQIYFEQLMRSAGGSASTQDH